MKTIKIVNDVLDFVLSSMKKSDMLCSLNKQALSQIADRATLIEYEKKEIIIKENDSSEAFFIIIKGELTILHSTELNNETVELGKVQPYNIIGDIGLLLEKPRTATIKAAEKSLLLKFDKSLFDYMFKKIPEFGSAVSRHLAARVDHLSSRFPLPLYGKDAPLPDENILKKIPMDFIIRQRVLPLKIEENFLSLGFINDPNSSILESLRRFVPGMEFKLLRIDNDYFNKVMQSQSGINLNIGTAEAPEDMAASGKSPDLDPLLQRMIAEGASDLHLPAGQNPYWRIDGELKAISDSKKLGANEVEDLLNEAMDEHIKKDFLKNNDADFVYSLPGSARFRVNLFRDENGVNAVFRFIPATIMTFEELNLPPVVKEFCNYSNGLVLVCGPTGSGKSTTLASMIDYINKNHYSHIITLEDPIEFLHKSNRSLVNQREIGAHMPNYYRGLRSALREDPDIILVGELRDAETVSLAIEAANTGHLVFGTLHTNSAISTISRIIDSFPPDEQSRVRTGLSDTLRGIISQVLCKRTTGGRVAAMEILVFDTPIANLVRENKTNQIASSMQTGKVKGNTIMNEMLSKLIKSGKIDFKEALSKTPDREGLRRLTGNVK
ncbi:MAG: PilT/PilU family type 4a pilus ATPase [Desulfobacteraceae bacterium]|nr:PilT/PilU family type 4a pilus ATPase [Desulfobacteraceae bacterium]